MEKSDRFVNGIIIKNYATKNEVDIEKNQCEMQAIGLLDNAVDFFKRAMTAIDRDPKESIINFSTAVELILKFPLMLEHWSLIVSGRPNRKEFLQGNFQSITFKETCELLVGIFDAKMDNKTITILNTVRAHRNTMVHYFHHTLGEKNKAEELTVEQAIAWFQLNGFLKSNSKKLRIEAYQSRLDELEKQLIKYSEYAKQKFESLKSIIEGHARSGDRFEECANCGQKAMYVSKGTIPLNCVCLVCDSISSMLEVKCPECSTDQFIYNSDFFECKNCHHKVRGDSDLYNLLDESLPISNPNDNSSDETPASCSICEEENLVCQYKGVYLCVHCWATSEKIYRCEFCNAPLNFDIGNSHYDGCMLCEGYMSYVMSKD